jgi:GT2 family glycosyltransferase
VTREALCSQGLAALACERSSCSSRRVDQMEPPMVSVIVPTARRPERIETCLASLRQLRYPDFEVIVVDNAPDQRATRTVVEALARADTRVRYVAEPRPGSSVARNRGAREAGGEILAFTDDDVVVDEEWLTWMVEPFLADPHVGVVTGLVLPARFDTPDQRWFEEVSGFGKGFEPRVFDRREHRADERLLYPYWGAVFGSGNSMAFRPAVLARIGGFDPALGVGSLARAGADIESFSHAILTGSRLAYEPRAVCWHEHRADGLAVERQMFNYSIGLTAILTKWLIRDPAMLKGLARRVAEFLAASRGAHDGSALPHELRRWKGQLLMSRRRQALAHQLGGYLLGPCLYLRSVIWARRLKLDRVLAEGLQRDE